MSLPVETHLERAGYYTKETLYRP